MLFDKAADAANAVLNAVPPADDDAARLLRHVLKVWGREQGVNEAELSDFVDGVLDHAESAVRAGRFGRTGA